MNFILMLHSHLPYVLNHGRWPHGSDWLTEVALDTYLPLLENLRALDAQGVNPDHGVLRLSFVHYTSPAEVDQLIQALDRVL